MNALETARSHGWLVSQPRDFQDALLSRCAVRKLGNGERICFANEPRAGLFALVKGVLKVEMNAIGGLKLLTTRQPVSWFGVTECFRGTSSSISLTAIGPSAILQLPRHEFDGLIQNSAFCKSFGVLAASHCEEARDLIAPLLVSDKELRIAGRLAHMASQLSHQEPAELPLSQLDLAEMCGLSRPTVSTVLNKFADLGLIKSSYRRISILDREGLEQYVNERSAVGGRSASNT